MPPGPQRKSTPIIRHKDFARRLADAVASHPHASQVRGPQKWIIEQLSKISEKPVTKETVSNWFSGETRPRGKMMGKLAQVLNVDEAWLVVGTTPDEVPTERIKRNVMADGIVNYVAGLIQLSGGSINFGDKADDATQPDLLAVINAKRMSIQVKLCQPAAGENWTVRFPQSAVGHILIAAVPTSSPLIYKLYPLPNSALRDLGTHKSGYIELSFPEGPEGLEFDTGTLPPLHSIQAIADAHGSSAQGETSGGLSRGHAGATRKKKT